MWRLGWIFEELFLYAIPSLTFITFHILCICGQIQPEIETLTIWRDAALWLYSMGFWGFILSLPVGVLLAPFTLLASFVCIPIALFTGGSVAFGVWAILVLAFAFIAMLTGTYFLPLFGEYKEGYDDDFVTGTHWEITFDGSGKGTARRVNEYADDSTWFFNALRFVGKLCVIMFGHKNHSL